MYRFNSVLRKRLIVSRNVGISLGISKIASGDHRVPTILGRRATPAARVVRAPEPERPKTASRGYDHLWRKVSERYRRKHPFCRFCEQAGRQNFCDDVDHKIPIEDGGDRLKLENLQPLCRACHNGIKKPMDAYAREHGQIYLLPAWCDDPSERPARFSAGSPRR